MKAVEVQISLDVLHNLLHLPKSMQFTKVSQTYQELMAGRFSLVVEGEDLPVITLGNSIPWGKIILHNEWCNSEERTHLVSGEVKIA